jgi:hypothetical protein
MMLGKAVIATGWSGNLDYMSPSSAALVRYQLVPVEDPSGRFPSGLLWAEPDAEHAASLLRQLHASPDLRRTLGERARNSIEDYIRTSQVRVAEVIRESFS